MTHYLLYWKPETASNHWTSGAPISYAASEQISETKLEPGDVVWACSAPMPQNKLCLVARFKVDVILNQEEAQKAFGDDIWSASHYVKPTHRQIPRKVILGKDQVRAISIESDHSPNLDPEKPLGNQLQKMRKLTSEAANILDDCWIESS
jgi:hypothetical protein